MSRDVEFADILRLHSETVWRVCSSYLRHADAEDAFQQTFVKLATTDTVFHDEEHRKAWLIRVASNICKDQLKSAHAKTDLVGAYEQHHEQALLDEGSSAEQMGMFETTLEPSSVRQALESLSPAYKVPLYLMYYEGYAAAQIAELLDIPPNTVYTRLARGRNLLKEVLERERQNE